MAAEDEGIVPPEPPEGNEAPTGIQPDNPAWSDFLGAIPPGMHDMVKPHLRKWDEGVNSRINAVHSEYADWKSFKDQGIAPQTIQEAYGIWQAINENPEEVYRLLGESYGFANQAQSQMQNPQQGQVNPQQQMQQTNQPSGDEYELGQGGQFNPELAELARYKAMTDDMAKIMLQQHQQQQELMEAQQADAVLDKELADAKAKYGDFNEEFVLRYVNAGMEVNKAVEAFQQLRNEIISSHNRPASPTVISGSGPLPSQQINPAKLNGKDTRNLVAEMVKASRQQG